MMRTNRHSRSTGRSAGYTLALVLVAVFPATASAACGDWLTGGRPHDSGSMLPGRIVDGIVPPMARQDAPPLSPGGCHGPQCDRNPAHEPGVPPAPTLETGPHQPAWLAALAASAQPDRGRFDRESPVGKSRYLPFVPERPPRG